VKIALNNIVFFPVYAKFFAYPAFNFARIAASKYPDIFLILPGKRLDLFQSCFKIGF